MKKQRKTIKPPEKPMEGSLLVAIVASAVFAGMLAGLVIIGHHG